MLACSRVLVFFLLSFFSFSILHVRGARKSFALYGFIWRARGRLMEPEASWHLGRLGPARAGALAPAGSEFRVPRESERGREPEAVERRGATCELSFL